MDTEKEKIKKGKEEIDTEKEKLKKEKELNIIQNLN